MQIFLTISDLIIPLLILLIVIYGATKRVDVYEAFIRGAADGFQTVIKIMPTLIALMLAVGILRESGLLEAISMGLGRFTERIGFPGALLPLTVVKMFSSSAATGLLLDVYKEFGTDSYIGRIASISMCCTETIAYTMSVYFMAANIRKTRYTLPGALIATLAGLVASVVLARITLMY